MNNIAILSKKKKSVQIGSSEARFIFLVLALGGNFRFSFEAEHLAGYFEKI